MQAVDPPFVVDNVTLERNGAGAVQLKALGVGNGHLSAGAVTPDKESAASLMRFWNVNNDTALSAADTRYFGPNGSANTTEEPDGVLLAPCDATICGLDVRIGGPCAAGNSVTLTVRKNGVDQNLTATWDNATGAGAQTLSDADTFDVAAGDRIDLKCVKVGVTGTNTKFSANIKWRPR